MKRLFDLFIFKYIPIAMIIYGMTQNPWAVGDTSQDKYTEFTYQSIYMIYGYMLVRNYYILLYVLDMSAVSVSIQTFHFFSRTCYACYRRFRAFIRSV